MRVSEYFEIPRQGPLSGPRISELRDKHFPDSIKHEVFSIPEKDLFPIFNRGVGIEIEAEGFSGIPGLGAPWVLTGDDSLRNGGIEILSRYGLRISNLWSALNSLNTTLKKLDSPLHFSERTSVHVHLDCRAFNETQLELLVVLYALFENVLFNFSGAHRKHNIFCVPLRESSNSFAEYSEFYKELYPRWDRYCGLNLCALREHGTVEFRHMEGNADPERIFIWSMLLALLQQAARTMTKSEVVNLLCSVKGISSYRMAVSNVFHGFEHLLIWGGPDMDRAASDAKMLLSTERNGKGY